MSLLLLNNDRPPLCAIGLSTHSHIVPYGNSAKPLLVVTPTYIIISLIITIIIGIVPFDDLSMLGFESVSLLEDFGRGVSPTFTIVNSRKYIREINSENSSAAARNSTLPPSFLLFVSYKPQNNTVLRLLSSYIISRTVELESQTAVPPRPIVQNSPNFNPPESDNTFLGPEIDNGSGSESELDSSLASGSGDPSSLIPTDENKNDSSLASLLLSTTATYLQEDSFLDIWSNITGTEQHDIVFMVVNGTISSCLDGEFKLGEPAIGLWNANITFEEEGEELEGEKESIQVKFSDALHVVQSVVSFMVTIFWFG